jgi:multiple sugar transport system substrate-binding protein
MAMRKTLFLSLALALLVLAFGSLVSAQDQVTLTLMGHSSTTAEDETLNEQVALFMEENPNVTVDVQLVPEYETVIQTAFASGDYPEVFYVGQSRLAEYAQAGVLAPVEDNVADLDDFYPALINTFTYDGTLYCVPKDFSNLALEYNTDLFDEAGVEYPTADWTWDDLRGAAEAITEATGQPALSLNPDIDRWFAFYVQAGGQLYDEDGAWSFASDGANFDAAVQALDAYAGLYQDGLSATAQDLGAGWPGEAFGNGSVAMTMEGNWIIQYLIDNFPDLNWGVAELPAGPAGEGTLTFSECYGVGADNDHPEESWALVNFLTGVEGAARIAEGGFGPMPPRMSAADAWLENRGAEFEPFVTGSENAVAPITPPGFQEFRDTLGNGIQQVFAGNATSEDAINDARDVATELMEDM